MLLKSAFFPEKLQIATFVRLTKKTKLDPVRQGTKSYKNTVVKMV